FASNTYSGMIRPTAGSIWIPITSTMKSFRPVNRYFASAIAARKASTTAIATVTATTIRLFLTSVQKYWVCSATRKWPSVGLPENQVGVTLLSSSVGLNALEIIQKTGNTITAKT